MTSKDSWIDGIQMEQYTPPGDDDGPPIETNESLQIPAGIVWTEDDTNRNQHSLNLATCLDLNTPETVLQWKALQKSEFLMKKLSKENSQKGSLPVGTCQIHLGGTAVHLDLIAPIQVVDDDDDKPCELVLGSDFVKHYNIQVDLPNHQLVVPEGESCVTIPFIQPRKEIVEKADE